MKYFREFLESSTIHGLVYISTAKGLAKLFWIWVVILGFSVAGILIYQAVDNWRHSPIKTTIETRPISDLTFPTITVCPPRNTFTDINYEMMLLENMTMTNETRQELVDFVEDKIMKPSAELLFTEHLNVDTDQFYNMYHGYSKIRTSSTYNYQTSSRLYTSASSGQIQTPHFGEDYDEDKVKRAMKFYTVINLPTKAIINDNITLLIDLEKVTQKIEADDYSKDEVYFLNTLMEENLMSFNFTENKRRAYEIKLERWIYPDTELSLNTIPGFRVKWNFDSKPQALYSRDRTNLEFRR